MHVLPWINNCQPQTQQKLDYFYNSLPTNITEDGSQIKGCEVLACWEMTSHRLSLQYFPVLWHGPDEKRGIVGRKARYCRLKLQTWSMLHLALPTEVGWECLWKLPPSIGKQYFCGNIVKSICNHQKLLLV